MDELDPQSRAELDAFRQHNTPNAEIVDREWAGFQRRLLELNVVDQSESLDAVAEAVAGQGSATAAAKGAASVGVWIKTIVVSGTLGGVGAYAVERTLVTEAPQTAATSDRDMGQTSARPAERSVHPRAESDPSASAQTNSPPPPLRRDPTRSRPEVSPRPPDPPSGRRRELVLMGRARAALSRGDHVEARARLADHEREFPGGVLATEREAWLAQSRCTARLTDEGRAAARTFLRDHPESPLRAQLEAACELTSK
ncbi:MAG: hypothetical protein V3V08_24360 [Nannocystaceae bacterium]